MSRYNEKYFNKDEMHCNSIDEQIDKNEEILWRGKPKKSAFIWSKILNLLPLALLWITFDGFFIYGIIKTGAFEQLGTIFVIFIVVFFLFHLAPFWIWLSNALSAALQHKNIEYAFTNKRIIIRSGIIVDIKIIYYMDIQTVNLRVGLIDRLLKVGDIYITSKSGTARLNDIENPYKILNFLQKIVNDIKTDMYYPNNLRPNENKGYQTNYKID